MTGGEVLAGFIIAMVLVGFVLGMTVHAVWQQWADGGGDG